MIGVYTKAQVRAAEAALMRTVPPGSLMEKASFGLAQVVLRLLREHRGGAYGARVALLVGPGGNGGDALYAGSFLRARGIGVTALLLTDRTYPGALAEFVRSGGEPVGVTTSGSTSASGSADSETDGYSETDSNACTDSNPGTDSNSETDSNPGTDSVAGIGRGWVEVVADADIVIDGIAGLGSGREVGLPDDVRAAVSNHPCVVAVDVPSGVAVDTGSAAIDAIRADVTVTFGCYKPAQFIAPGADLCGAIEFVDIGLAEFLSPADAGVLTAREVYESWPRQPYDGNKYSTGVVGIVAGSQKYAGAAVLCVGGALRAKQGMVRFVGESAASERVIDAWPECVISPSVADAGRAQAWVVGPGMGTDDAAAARLDEVLQLDVPALLDADALTMLKGRVADLASRTAPTVLTPHAGEFERIFFPIDDPLSAASRAADESGCVVLLKGPTTVIAAPGRPALINPTGTARLATAGTGDVLAGIIGSLMASGIEPRMAAAMGAFAHGAAARSASGPIIAGDLPHLLRAVLDEIVNVP